MRTYQGNQVTRLAGRYEDKPLGRPTSNTGQHQRGGIIRQAPHHHHGVHLKRLWRGGEGQEVWKSHSK